MEVVNLMSIDYSGFAFPKNAHDCEYCGRKNCWTNTHHIKSKGSGGDDTEDNLIELCGSCHRLVHDGIIEKEKLLKIIKNRRENT